MYCNKCNCEDIEIFQEKEPYSTGAIIGAILLFPIGLLFLLNRKTKTVGVCKKCGHKFEIKN